MPDKDSLDLGKTTLNRFIREREDFKRQMEADRDTLILGLGEDMVKLLMPLLKEIAQAGKVNKSDLLDIIRTIKVQSNVNVPEANVNVKIPEIRVPDVNVGKIKIPEIKIPEIKIPPIIIPEIKVPEIVMPKEMDVRGWVQLQGVSLNDPLPVQIRDADGRPVNFSSFTNIISGGGGGGGKSDYFTVKGFSQSAYSDLTNADGRLRVSVETGGSGLTDAELRASSVPVEQVSGAIWSTNVTGSFGTIYSTSDLVNSDNRLRVSVETGGSGLTDAELRASSVPVEQVSGAMWSVSVSGITSSLGATLLNGDGLYRDTLPISASALPLPTGAATSAAQLPDGHNVTVDNVSLAVTGTFWQATQPVSLASVPSHAVTNAGTFVTQENGGALTALQLLDNIVGVEDAAETAGGGLAMVGTVRRDTAASSAGTTGDNATLNTDATGNLWVNPQGNVAHDAADSGNPLKVGGKARTANPTAVANNDRVDASFDDLGRQLTRPVQVRDLISTAYVSKTTGSTFGTETTLFAGAASTFHDLIYVLASNDSTVAIGVDIRGTLAGGILMHLEIPANGTVGVATPVPLPAGDVGASWTIDLPDVTGTNVYVSALFSKEI